MLCVACVLDKTVGGSDVLGGGCVVAVFWVCRLDDVGFYELSRPTNAAPPKTSCASVGGALDPLLFAEERGARAGAREEARGGESAGEKTRRN